MNTVRTNAYAKLNLTLDITGFENGYHMLDSLVCTVDLFDRIAVRKRKDKLVNAVMRGMGSEEIPPERNNAVLAAQAFVSAFSTTGADITVYKNIPVGAGMGGSSADAAGVLYALSRLYGVTDQNAVKAVADSLGSDTGYLLEGGFARLRGRGERVERLALPKMNFLALCPKTGVSSAACYLRYDEEGCEYAPRSERVAEAFGAGDLAAAAHLFGNALGSAAASLNPDVQEALTELKAFSPMGVSVTGSGSACFALFETRELCEWAKSRYRGKFRAYILKSIDGRKGKGLRSPYSSEVD